MVRPLPEPLEDRPADQAGAAPARRFVVGWIAAWAAVGALVGAGLAYATSVDPGPALRLSVLFAELVGLTALFSARAIFPLFVALPYGLRLALEVLTLLSATIFGSACLIWIQPLFSLAQPRAVALIVLVITALAVTVGIALSTYDRMRAQIENTHRELRRKEALVRELAIARDVQRGLLPRDPPHIPGLELAGVCRPAREVGGDYFDYLPLAESRVGLVVADVAGKGVAAALFMAGVQASVRSLFGLAGDIGELNGLLNEHLCRSSSVGRYATFFAGRFDPGTRSLSYSNAGHPPPLVLRGGEVARLSAGGLPLGLFEGRSYASGRHDLVPGDLLALFTDGIVETPNAADEEYGEGRLIAALERHRERPLNEIVEVVLDELALWGGGAEPHDDATLMLARVS